MYTALLFLFAIGAVLALDDFEAMKKQLNTNYNSLDRLTARIQNLKDLVEKKLATKREADRKSKNMLLRLDRMNLDDDRGFKCRTAADGRQINFKCSTRQQCVGNILVCDNVADCEDGSDEDKDFCNLPFEVGNAYSGRCMYYHCGESEGSNISVVIRIEDIKRSDDRHNLVYLDARYMWNYGTQEIRTFAFTARYDFGTQSFMTSFVYNEAAMFTSSEFEEQGEYMFHVFHSISTRDQCGLLVLSKGRIHDFQKFIL